MRIALFSAVTRRIIMLAAGSPSTTARRPPPKSLLAAASLSSRRGIFFATASGPWHPKHLSERIGRTSRLNRTAGSAPKAGAPSASAKMTKPERSMSGLRVLFKILSRKAQQHGNHAEAPDCRRRDPVHPDHGPLVKAIPKIIGKERQQDPPQHGANKDAQHERQAKPAAA